MLGKVGAASKGREMGRKREPIYDDKVKMSVYWSRREYEALRRMSDQSSVPMTQMVRRCVLRGFKLTEGANGP
jgi:hypothetical protein